MATPLRPLPPGSTPGRRRRLSLQTVLLAVAGVVAVNLLVAATVIGGREDRPALPSTLEAVIPEPGSGILAQDQVGADLLDTFTGFLQIDGVEIPEDQLDYNLPLGEVGFRPGPGKEIVRFEEGLHSATIFYWSQELGDDGRTAAKSYTWQFRAH
ncbi:MAG: hypothetical protein ACRDYV_17220 [Acidimicrobiia bacterium]